MDCNDLRAKLIDHLYGELPEEEVQVLFAAKVRHGSDHDLIFGDSQSIPHAGSLARRKPCHNNS